MRIEVSYERLNVLEDRLSALVAALARNGTLSTVELTELRLGAAGANRTLPAK